MRLAPLLLALSIASPALAQTPGQTTIPEAALQAASQLREQALADDTAWKVTESPFSALSGMAAESESATGVASLRTMLTRVSTGAGGADAKGDGTVATTAVGA